MAGTAATLRTVGVITTCQQINDQDWKKPELKAIQAASLPMMSGVPWPAYWASWA
jgi:hypothetical protein